MNRQRFHREALIEAQREFGALDDVEKAIEIFLLTAIGTLGIVCGFACVIDKGKDTEYVVSRGFPQEEIETLNERVPEILRHYFPETLMKKRVWSLDSVLMTKDGLRPEHRYCPELTKVLIRLSVNDTYFGLAGFGVKILTDTYGDEDIKFLLDLTDTLLLALLTGRFNSTIRQLKAELREKNDELTGAIKKKDSARKDLSRRLFHLKSFYDIFIELSGIKDVERITEIFLLMIIGMFSVKQGFIMLFDREEKTVQMTSRGVGIQRSVPLTEDEIEDITSKYLEAAIIHNLGSMNARLFTDRKLLEHSHLQIDASIGVLFIINEKCLGLIALGDKLTRQRFSEDDRALLMTLVYNLMVFWKTQNRLFGSANSMLPLPKEISS